MDKLRDLIQQYGGKALRYSTVSLCGVAVTQILIVVFLAIDWPNWVANAVAVMISSIPAYMLNRQWVWNKRDSHSFSREVVPFWGMALLGLLLSTFAVWIVSDYTDAAIAVSLTNIASFGVLWVGKFFILEKVLFQGEHVPIGEAIIDSEPWVAAGPHEDIAADEA
jgi:putative flippase GtrA